MSIQYILRFLRETPFVIFVLICILNICSLKAQSFYPEEPAIVKPSPQAAAFTRYGDYPVNYNTGMVDMRVPIYNVKSGSLNVPIDISFHASGRMANDKTPDHNGGMLGVRWVLNAGGVITRAVRGYPDEWDELASYSVPQNHGNEWEHGQWVLDNLLQTTQQWEENLWLYNWLFDSGTADIPTFEELYHSNTESYYMSGASKMHIGTYYDSELDVFDYQLPSGKSGKFILKNENGVVKALTIPYEPLGFEFTPGTDNEGLYVSISITDVDGTIYNYGGGNRYEYYDDIYYEPAPLPRSIPTAWYLESVVSADKQDTIVFNYQVKLKPNGGYKESIMVTDKTFDAVWAPYNYDGYEYSPIQLLTLENNPGKADFGFRDSFGIRVPYVESIDFKHGNITFIHDHYPTLQEILITGDDSKKIKFDVDYFQNGFIRHLKNVEFLSITNSLETIEKKYSFDYYEPKVYMSFLPEKKDWWGYYNNNVTLNPTASNGYMSLFYFGGVNFDGQQNTTIDIGNSGANNFRNPDLESMKVGMLKSITYPTGGVTEFEYENNFFDDAGTKTLGPGLRISKITNRPNLEDENNKTVRVFKYGEIGSNGEEDGMGYINPEHKPYANLVQESRAYRFWVYLDPHSNTPCLGDTNASFAYRVRTYSADPLVDFGSPVTYYDKVTEYSSDDQNKGWKTEYEYSHKYFDSKEYTVSYYEYPNTEPSRKFSNPYRAWAGGKLKSKTVYKRNGTSLKKLLKETYDYETFISDGVWDMPTYRQVHFNVDFENYWSSAPCGGNSELLSFQYWFDLEESYDDYLHSIIGYGYRLYFSGAENLVNKTVETFDDDEVLDISTTNFYSFERQYNQAKTEETANSDLKIYRVEYEYPFENLSEPINNKMLDLNMVGVPIKTSQYINHNNTDTFLQSNRTEYDEWSTVYNNWGIDSNDEVDIIRPKIKYFKKGNGSEEPIIEFKSYYGNGKTKEVSKVDGNPVIYVWGYEGEYPIAKIENMTYDLGKPNSISISQQDLIDDAILAAENETTEVTENTLRSKLQLLRDGFPSAMVTTYTYDPLVGITSITDPKGYTTYYEYDRFGRLEKVKDADGKILSENKYNYKQ